MKIGDAQIEALAPNAQAVANARGLLKQGQLSGLSQSADGSLLFGQCAGSGKEPYQTSVDFLRPEAPIARCTCPSRQLPCKHALALLFARAKGATFAVADIPADLLAKREKVQARAAKQATAVDTPPAPRQVNKAALAKKLAAQLAGLELLAKLTQDIVRGGLGTLNPKTARELEEQARQLGDQYLPGAQIAVREFTLLFADEKPSETTYSAAVDTLVRLHALARRGTEYLTKRLADPELAPDVTSTLDEWLGHAWQLAELRQLGRVSEQAELLQLAFCSYDAPARQEWVDAGLWLNLASGAVQETRNYRPYKAKKYVKEEDSCAGVMQVQELCVYPGDLNPRIRWEAALFRDRTPGDLAKARELAQPALAPILKTVRNQLRQPLADKTPVALLRFQQLGTIGDALVMVDGAGERLGLIDDPTGREPASCHLLPMLPPAALADQALLVRFHHQLDRGELRGQPLALVTPTEHYRLTY